MAGERIQARCDCGAVAIEVPAPRWVTECLCDGCRKMGVLWAYYRPEDVRFVAGEGATDTYQRASRTQDFHRCKTCGCVTHWAKHDRAADNMGVNARLMDPAVVARAEREVVSGP